MVRLLNPVKLVSFSMALVDSDSFLGKKVNKVKLVSFLMVLADSNSFPGEKDNRAF